VRTYPAVYHNDDNLFPTQPDGFYWDKASFLLAWPLGNLRELLREPAFFFLSVETTVGLARNCSKLGLLWEKCILFSPSADS
jgi:hypothetical protein